MPQLYPVRISVHALVQADSTQDARKQAFESMTTLLQAGLLALDGYKDKDPVKLQDMRVRGVENIGTPEDAPLRKQL